MSFVGHQTVDDVSKADSLTTYSNPMAAAADILDDAPVIAPIEPFNLYDRPGYFIDGLTDSISSVREISPPFIQLNGDLFHMQRGGVN